MRTFRSRPWLDSFIYVFLIGQRQSKVQMRAGFTAQPLPAEARLRHQISQFTASFMTLWRRFWKRTFDLAVTLSALVLTAPLFLLIAAAIKLDSPGPVFYQQQRVGLRGRNFFMFKFRSMRTNAESQSGPVWAKENDPRVTRLGRFLRETHLDELPQLFNILRGEMSLVGPRPERPHFVKELRKVIPHYDKRHFAKPGVTGLAQVRQRYDENVGDVRNKVRYDVLYIKKMCPILDLKVIALTAVTMILRTGR
ncbi:MAG: exopolysaccharide biosynthesis polyprenyl glycosylphosphotransferase [Candidatus Omnitrophica bacterium]|nr:exopolysaccharide biosynthesis polyprenyl glycosylphosphotransferase [Candidatus Omnitrophota bacterium]